MDLEATFEALWNRLSGFEVDEKQPRRCTFATRFFEWTSQLLTNVTRDPDVVSVNQAKVLLLDKYFEWRSFVPRSHRDHLGTTGHSCIFQVFVEAYQQLKVLDLSLTPPMLFLPPSPPATSNRPTLPEPHPAQTQVLGIYIGEEEMK